MMATYFRAVPREVFEAATLDGASILRAFWTDRLPDGPQRHLHRRAWCSSSSSGTTCCIALTFTNNDDLRTIQVGLLNFTGAVRRNVSTARLFAAICINVVRHPGALPLPQPEGHEGPHRRSGQGLTTSGLDQSHGSSDRTRASSTIASRLGIGERHAPALLEAERDRRTGPRRAYEVDVDSRRRRRDRSGRIDGTDSEPRRLARSPPLRLRERVARPGPGRGADGQRRAVAWSEPADRRGRAARRRRTGSRVADRAGAGRGRRRRRAGRRCVRREFDARRATSARPGCTSPRTASTRSRSTARRVGDDVLAPGWTSYPHRLRYQTHDVTDLLRAGRQHHRRLARRRLVPRPRRLRRRHPRPLRRPTSRSSPSSRSRHADGTVDRRRHRRPPGAPRRARSPPPASTTARRYDARLDAAGWSTPGFDDSGWSPRRRPSTGTPRTLVAPTGPAGALHRELCARSRSTARRPAHRSSTSARTSSGRLRIRVDGPRGHTRHPPPRRGPRGRRTVRPAAARRAVHRHATSCAGDAARRSWEPRFTIHGFRYAEIERLAGRPRPTTSRRSSCHTDMRRTGWFDCSRPAAQPAARERRVEHARQLRRPAHRLPAARRTPRLDRRHPGLRPHRARSSTTAPACSRSWLARRRRRAAPRRHRARVRARGSRAAVFPIRPGRRLGRRRRPRPVDAVPALRRPRRARRRSTTACGPGSTSSTASPARPACGTPASSSATGSTRPHRRTTPARRRTDRVPRRHRVLRALRPASSPTIAGVLGDARRRRALRATSPTRDPAGLPRPSTSPRPAGCRATAPTAYALALRVRPARRRAAAARRGRRPARRARRGAAATASPPASSAPRSSATRSPRPGTSTPPTTCSLQDELPVVAVPGDAWAPRRSGSAGTACCPTAPSTPAT